MLFTLFAQARELLEDGAKIKEQRARIEAVNEQLKSAQAAHTLASSELQVLLHIRTHQYMPLAGPYIWS